MNKIRPLLWIFLTLLTLQVFNFFLLEKPQLISFINRIPFLDFAIVWNQGIAFGIGHGKELKWLFIFMSAVICLAFFFFGIFVVKNEVGTVLVVSGGLSNMIDRLIHGSVLDFIGFSVVNFPLFNLSDILISLGIGSFVWIEFRKMGGQGK